MLTLLKKTRFIEAGALKIHLELLKPLKVASCQPIFAVLRRTEEESVFFSTTFVVKAPPRYSGSLKFWLICFSVRLVSEKFTRERRDHYLLLLHHLIS